MTGSVSELLETADLVLQGAGGHRARSACWLTRSALEIVVDDLLGAKGLDSGQASMRSRLTCLQVAYDGEGGVASTADYAWSRLSQACHVHAYELSPTDAEARELVERVRQLAGHTLVAP